MDPPPAKQSRKAIKVSQKKALRAWYYDYSNGKQSLQSAGQWWLRTYGYELSPSTCCEILSEKWAYLDDTPISTGQDPAIRRGGQWKELEEALFEWEQRYEAGDNPLTGAMFRQKAEEFWRKLPCYQGLPVPKLSDGWLRRFKHRYNIRQRNKYGEGGSADHSDQTAKMIADIRDASVFYNPEDIYNMDETGYFWKMIPEKSNKTERVGDQQQEKARITVALTCNATGSRKLPIWFIGKAARPLCFRAANIPGLESLGAVWRYNSTAWMVGIIMEEYLRWFDSQMERPSLLLMDYFSAHAKAIETFIGDAATEALRWTTVLCLPPNATSQPLHQGIIQNWKTVVRSQFIQFMVDSFDAGQDPITIMNVLRAIRWGISAWENDVSATTIRNCWIRSKVYNWSGLEDPDSNEWTDSEGLMVPIMNNLITLQRQGQICERMSIPIRTFLNPIAEEIDDQEEDIMEAIVARYGEKRVAESEEEIETIPKVSIQEALSALETLKLYEEQQEYGDPALTKTLRRRERELHLSKSTVLDQGKVDSWFGNT